MRRTPRRQFLQTLGQGAGGLLLAPSLLAALPTASPVRKYAHDRVLLGHTGIRASRLALGTGTRGSEHASDQTRMGMERFLDHFQHAFEQGINFWDTADQYGSHDFLRAMLQRIPRREVVILTKTHASTGPEMEADLDRFCREIGTDYLDIVLLHCMLNAAWPQEKAGAMHVLEQAREKGRIRAHGVSCHNFGAMQVASRLPWVQVELQRINPLGVPMDAEPPKVIALLREMKAAGQAVVGMKIFAEGRLSHQPDLALGHAIRLDCLDAFTIGMMGPSQLDDVAHRLPLLSVA